jgi:hypothetical protein
MVLRGVLPYPDPVRRARVRRRARNLAARDPWPQDEAAATGLDYATLALLRTLALQRATRRAVRNRDREGAALLARTSMETCILGLWCVHIPEAADRLRAAELKVAPAMLTFVSYTGLIPDTLIKHAVDALGQPKQLPTVRSMAEQIDEKTGATLAIPLVRRGVPARVASLHPCIQLGAAAARQPRWPPDDPARKLVDSPGTGSPRRRVRRSARRGHRGAEGDIGGAVCAVSPRSTPRPGGW